MHEVLPPSVKPKRLVLPYCCDDDCNAKQLKSNSIKTWNFTAI